MFIFYKRRRARCKQSAINFLFTFCVHVRPMHLAHSPSSAQTAAHVSLNRLQVTLALASSLANAGRVVDLSGLEADTSLLCAQVLDLPPSEGQALRPALLAVHTSVARLIASLQVMVS